MEQTVLRSCDRILANTPGNRRALLETYRFLAGEKVEVVTNGYDRSAVAQASSVDAEAGDYDMLYFGEMYPGMIDLLLDAVDLLVEKGSPYVPRIGVYGWITPHDLDRLRRRGFEKRIEFRGTLSYADSIATMAEARSLLLLLWHDEEQTKCVPSKLYPYLAAGPPVVAIAPRGDATEIVDDTGAGVSISATDPSAVADRLEEVVKRIRQGGIPTDRKEERIRQYSLDSLVDRIDEMLTAEVNAW
jgi:glycosyltransferase involved in cell wall biosynthesis